MFRNCIQSNNGHIYCWDCGKKRYIKFAQEEVVEFKDLPTDVLIATADRLEHKLEAEAK